MEQADLRRLESQCVQEEVPRCIAACPLHVDAKTFCKLMGQRRTDKAWQTIARTLPLPGVLARLCDGPCRDACVRKDAGGAVEMDALERFCAENAQAVAPPKPLPSRGKSVAVLGGGMAGLCGAWELARRGFDTTLYCPVPGESVPELPEGVLAREIDSLEKMGVRLEVGQEISRNFIESQLNEKDAVFIDSDVVDGAFDFGDPDGLTLGTGQGGLFVSPAGSPVWQAAAARRAANSIERFTQGVSMVTGRELEGPYETRLFTSLEKVEATPSSMPADGYTEPTARDEAKRCLQCECMECVKSCEYLRHYKFYPKVYARQIYNNESIVMGTRQANTMINSCMLCGLCETICQLTASDPKGVEYAYADLCNRLGEVGLMLHCCGAPAEWAGRVPFATESMAVLRGIWESIGCPKLIAACPSCLKTLRAGLPDAEITSHWSILRALGLPAQAGGRGEVLAINDPCAARHNHMLQEDARAVLEQAGVDVVEPEMTGDLTQCCGYGGLLSEANPELGKLVAGNRAGAANEDWVTYCVMCRDMIAKTGKRAMHFYDLVYPKGEDPAARPAPGYSERRENRVRLREGLLHRLWREDEPSGSEVFEGIEVAFSEQAASCMEERRILKSDVQKVLLEVGRTGKRFVHGETGHFLACHRPVIVTYWVEYEEKDGGYLVHNVWSHRMRIKGGRS